MARRRLDLRDLGRPARASGRASGTCAARAGCAGACPPVADGPVRVWVQRFLTFQFVCLGWVFFNASGMSQAFAVLGPALHRAGARPSPLVTPLLVVIVVGTMAAQFVPDAQGGPPAGGLLAPADRGPGRACSASPCSASPPSARSASRPSSTTASDDRPPHAAAPGTGSRRRSGASHPHAELAPPDDGRVRAPWTRVSWPSASPPSRVWFLLFAPTLQHNAQVSPVGHAAHLSLDLIGPVAALSRGPAALAHRLGHRPRTDCPAGPSGSRLGAAARRPRAVAPDAQDRRPGTAAPAATTTTTVPPNPKLPTAANPLRVLIVGDSLGLDMGGPLQDDLADTGVVNAALDARESTGLTRPDYFNWPAELAADLKTVQPQVVVIMIGANDAQDFLGPPDVPYTSPQWNTLYAQRVAQFMQIAQSGGATVIWVGMPPMQNPGLERPDGRHQRPGPAPGGARPSRRSPSSARTSRSARRRAATPPSSPTPPARSSTSGRPTGRT